MPNYKPETIDTSKIELNADLEDLVERLAQNNHDHWARKRLDEGLLYGVARNDEKREHPDLVPYGDLPDSEKEYDRKSVIETLKAVMAVGYEIKRKPGHTRTQHESPKRTKIEAKRADSDPT